MGKRRWKRGSGGGVRRGGGREKEEMGGKGEEGVGVGGGLGGRGREVLKVL